MQVIKPLWIWLALAFLMVACVFHFDPEIGGIGNTLVVHGRVSDQEGWQYVEISRSTPVNSKGKLSPVSGYTVEIHDDLGNVFMGSETEPGLYACMITKEYLMPGTRFKLKLTSMEGKRYESDFDELLPCPPIQDITYEIQKEYTPDPDLTYYGAQFFVSTDASDEYYAQNYLWEMEETWQYHSSHQAQDYYDGVIHMVIAKSDSLFFCWDTRRIPEIYVYSTRNLNSGQIRNFPLHYINDQTDKLRVKYSLLLTQYSLSETAYNYWKILDGQSKQGGELFESQPGVLTGNIHSLDDPDETVLGLFYATSMQEKRAFFRPSLFTLRPQCDPWGFDEDGLLGYLETFHPSQYPIYLVRINDSTVDYTQQACFDCRMRGGTTEIPEFWNDEFNTLEIE